MNLEKMLVWLSLARHLIKLHFLFFKSGAHLGSSEGSGLLFKMAHPTESPAVKLYTQLAGALHPGSPEESELWKVMVTKYGPKSEWPEARHRLVEDSLLTILGSFWRRFVVRLAGYPYRLALLVHSELGEEDGGRDARHS